MLFTERSLDNVDTAAFGDAVAEYVHKDDGPELRALALPGQSRDWQSFDVETAD